ncbi:MAG: type II toxin-antitoxin system RelB/DinJ family antitoxin [Betaproteobacteria bacterium]|nr:type II toxin-antitoxin system RelB/DinJ family antitoxin [Betaproteobacteria bacterium]
MADTTNLSIRLDKKLKDEADQILGAMGMSLTTAISVFVRQVIRQKKIPFEISLTERESSSIAMQDAIAASRRIWKNSAQNGTDKMSPEEIDAEIATARAERKARKTGTRNR